MDTIALRFSDNIAPEGGTIKTHDTIIKEKGYVWYGKFGSSISSSVREKVLRSENPRILLIHSGTNRRYWAYISAISNSPPAKEEYPAYYHNQEERCGSWFKITKFEKASPEVMSKCFVKSSGTILSNASRHSMSPYFFISYGEDNYAEQ